MFFLFYSLNLPEFHLNNLPVQCKKIIFAVDGLKYSKNIFSTWIKWIWSMKKMWTPPVQKFNFVVGHGEGEIETWITQEIFKIYQHETNTILSHFERAFQWYQAHSSWAYQKIFSVIFRFFPISVVDGKKWQCPQKTAMIPWVWKMRGSGFSQAPVLASSRWVNVEEGR